jgi:uncharacterized zinc-type alcohol dehydrogenase-like protein
LAASSIPTTLAGEEQYCESGPTLTYNGYERDGKTPTYGGYSTRITVDENYVLSIPKGARPRSTTPLRRHHHPFAAQAFRS